MSSRTRNSVLNMSVGVLAQSLTLIVGFVSRTVFIQFLSAEYLGINGLLSNVLTLLSFAELGIGEAMVYAMYKPAKENDMSTMRILMQNYKKTYTIIACIVGGIGVALSFFADYFVVSPPDIPENFQVIFIFFSLNNMLSYFLTYKKSVLIVYQQNYIVTITAHATTLVQHIVQITAIALTRQYYLYLFIQLVFTVVNNLIISLIVNKKYPWLKQYDEDGKLPEETQQTITRNVKSLSIAKIAGVVSNGADNVIISKLLGLTSVGLASNYTLITNSIHGILWSGLSSVTSSLGNFNVDSSVSRRRDLFDEIYLCSFWLYGFFSVGVVTLANTLIELWLGSDFLLSNSIVFALVLIVYIGGVNFPVYVYQTTLGMYDKMKWPYLFSGVLNIVLSIVLGLKLGMLGIYLATSISRLCTSEVFGGYYVYKYGLEISPWKYVVKYLSSLMILIMNIFLTGLIVSQVPIEGMVGFLLKVFLCTIVSNAVFFIVFFKTAAFARLKNRVWVLLKR